MANQDPPSTNEQEKRAIAVQKEILASMLKIDRQIIALLNALEKWSNDTWPKGADLAKFAAVAESAQQLHALTATLKETCDKYGAGTQEGGNA